MKKYTKAEKEGIRMFLVENISFMKLLATPQGEALLNVHYKQEKGLNMDSKQLKTSSMIANFMAGWMQGELDKLN